MKKQMKGREDGKAKYSPEDYETWYHEHAEPIIGPLKPNKTLCGAIPCAVGDCIDTVWAGDYCSRHTAKVSP